jgi:xanthine dehydrogenase small subunit
MVVSLYDTMQREGKLTAHSARRGLVGNLCRCTGYDSIIKAAIETDTTNLKPLDHDGSALATVAKEEVSIATKDFRFFKPASLQSALRFRSENPNCLIVSGATDLGVQCNKGTRKLSVVLSTHGILELNSIVVSKDFMRIGAGVTLTKLEETSADCLPELSRFLAYFGSPLIKNAGTLAGNLVNGSPIADTVPALFALDAEIEIASVSGTRKVNIHNFYTGYRKTVLTPQEMVTSIRIPLPDKNDIFKLYKISRRKDLDIASFGAAVWMRRNGIIDDIRIAYGGVAPTVVRVGAAESILRGKTATLELFEEAGRAARDAVAPISDVRGSSDYRLALAENILVKFWHDLDEV